MRDYSVLFYADICWGSLNAGLAYSFLMTGFQGQAALFVFLSGLSLHMALAEHDGVSAFPILMPRR